MSGDKHQPNGTDPVENGINGTQDTEMGDADPKSGKGVKDKTGEDEMTVVVPPSKAASKPFGAAEDPEGDIEMQGAEENNLKPAETIQDPQSKAVSGMAK